MRYLIWDFDDTLGYREGKWSGALVDAARVAAPDLALTLETVQPHLGQGFPWHNHHLPHNHITTGEMWWRELMLPILEHALAGVGFGTDDARRVALQAREEFTRVERWTLFPETLSVLERFSAQGWEQMILSNHVPELPRIVEGVGLSPHISRCFNSAEIGYEKPHRAAFEHLLSHIPAGSTVRMIGDSMVADVLGAEAAGIPAILVRKPHPDAQRYAPDLAGLFKILEAMESGEVPPFIEPAPPA